MKTVYPNAKEHPIYKYWYKCDHMEISNFMVVGNVHLPLGY